MRLRAGLILMLLAALVYGMSGFAGADESVQTEEAKVKPKKLPKKGKRNIKLKNTIRTFDRADINQPKSAVRTILDLPKQIKVNSKSVRYCKTDAAGLEAAPTVEAAKAACGKASQVSIDRGSFAEVRVGSTTGPATTIPVDVVAFNERGKRLLLYSKPQGTFAGVSASILVGKLKPFGKVPGRPKEAKRKRRLHKQSLDVSIPTLAAGAISLFEVTVKKGKYLKAKCKPKRMRFQATTFFTDGSTTTDDTIHKCKPKGKKKRR